MTGRSVRFEGYATDGKAPHQFSWNFGDGSPGSEGDSVVHIYAGAGNYDVTLTVTDENGDSATLASAPTVTAATREEIPALLGDLRVASFNTYQNRSNEGDLLSDLEAGDDAQIGKVAKIIQGIGPT